MIKDFIRSEFQKKIGVMPTEEIVERLYKEFLRVKEEYIRMGFKEDEAEVLAKGTIRNAIESGRAILRLRRI